MFENMVTRLLREKWDSVEDLAHELYAILKAGVPVTHEGQLTLTGPPGDDRPLLVLEPSSNAGYAIQITKPHTSTTPGVKKAQETTLFNQNGDVDQGTVTAGSKKKRRTWKPIPGTITGGSGNEYSVALHEDGVDKEPTKNVQAKQLQIDLGEQIPIGTWVMVYEWADLVSEVKPEELKEDTTRLLTVGSKPEPKYYLYVPVWLE